MDIRDRSIHFVLCAYLGRIHYLCDPNRVRAVIRCGQDSGRWQQPVVSGGRYSIRYWWYRWSFGVCD